MATVRAISEAGLDLIAQHEGIVLESYRDPAGLLTIGIGHLLTKSELASGKLLIRDHTVRWREGITEAQSFDLLRQDVALAEACITDALGEKRTHSLTQPRYDALVSFVFNCGCVAFGRSTLCMVLKEGRYTDVPAQMRRWVYAGGVKLAGLESRRDAEVKLWESGTHAAQCPKCNHRFTVA